MFNPDFYHSWASDVESAFAEREWSDYLDITKTQTDPKDKAIIVQAHAFLNQSIPYEHKTRIRNCKTAAEIWNALKEEYASQTREDELRLEGILLDFKKQATDSLSTHIAKFSNIISAVMAQQPEDQQYDDSKVNRYFLRSLETANIPNEDWKGFITSLGKTWLNISTHKLYAEARTYYATHIMSQQKSALLNPSNASLIESQDNLRALATTTSDRFGPVPRLHLAPFNAPTGPRNQQYHPNLAYPQGSQFDYL